MSKWTFEAGGTVPIVRLKHSPLATASVALGVFLMVAQVTMLSMMLYLLSVGGESGKSTADLITMLLMGAIAGNIVGLGLGIVAVMDRDSSRGMAVVGIALNGTMLVMMAIILALGMTMHLTIG